MSSFKFDHIVFMYFNGNIRLKNQRKGENEKTSLTGNIKGHIFLHEHTLPVHFRTWTAPQKLLRTAKRHFIPKIENCATVYSY